MHNQSIIASDGQQLEKMWKVFAVGEHQPISMRAISPVGVVPKLPTINATFNLVTQPDVASRKSAFQREVRRLNEVGYNVYLVMNPIRPDFGPPISPEAAVRDVDIECRSVLLLDFDRAGDTKQPASAGEVHAAATLAREVCKWLASVGWPAPVRALSGNGFHLYFRLDDLANDGSSKALIKSLLVLLAFQFDTADVKIDTAVHNASRVTKVPGTIARKAHEVVGRPFRMALLVDEFAPTIVTADDLERAIEALKVLRPPVPPTRPPTNKQMHRQHPDTPRRRADLGAMLVRISADCSYEVYRDVTWAILSTGWADAEEIAGNWCMTAPSRYDQANFHTTVRSYDASRALTPGIGTIRHLAAVSGSHG